MQDIPPYLQKVWDLVADGKSNKVIAHELDISEQSVKNHVSSLLLRTDKANRTALAVSHPRYSKCRS